MWFQSPVAQVVPEPTLGSTPPRHALAVASNPCVRTHSRNRNPAGPRHAKLLGEKWMGPASHDNPHRMPRLGDATFSCRAELSRLICRRPEDLTSSYHDRHLSPVTNGIRPPSMKQRAAISKAIALEFVSARVLDYLVVSGS